MMGNVSDASDRDISIICLDCDSASVRMDDRNHIIDIGVLGKDFAPDLVGCVAHYSCYTLD